jgi:hypothetical protein
MANLVSLRGLALPFEWAGFCYGRWEFFAAGALNAQLATQPRVFLNFVDHAGPSIACPLQLFADRRGLFFKASITAEVWDQIRAYMVNGTDRRSVGVSGLNRTESVLADGRRYVRIMEAAIDHVTICDDRAVYGGTGVWPGPEDRVGDLPPRLARLEAAWIGAWRRKAALKAITSMRKRAADLALSRVCSDGSLLGPGPASSRRHHDCRRRPC